MNMDTLQIKKDVINQNLKIGDKVLFAFNTEYKQGTLSVFHPFHASIDLGDDVSINILYSQFFILPKDFDSSNLLVGNDALDKPCLYIDKAALHYAVMDEKTIKNASTNTFYCLEEDFKIIKETAFHLFL